MDRRQAFSRFAPTGSSHAAAHARARRRQGQRARVGKSGDLYLDPATFRKFYTSIYEAHPGILTLCAIAFSLGDRLTQLIDTANEVEAAGGGSAQLKLDLMRRREDWFEIYFMLRRVVLGDSDDPDADYAKALKWTFEGFPQDEGLYGYENGEALPPRYGLAWEIGSLYNQVWAMWHPATWIHEDPDEPWYSWVPVAIAAGWVGALNDVQSLVTEAPGGGAGWGAELAAAGEATELKVIELKDSAIDFGKQIAGATTGALLGGLLVGGILLGRRR